MTLGKAIAYILNDRKNDEGILTASNCVFDSSDAQAVTEQFERQLALADDAKATRGKPVVSHHIIQSFKPGEVTPEEALEIGVELVERFTGGDYYYVISTHVDRKHVHNHIQLCPVNVRTGKKLRVQRNTLRGLRRMSDRIVRERGLSVLPEWVPDRYRPTLGEMNAMIAGRSKRDILRANIDLAVGRSRSWEGFVVELRRLDVDVEARGGYVTFSMPGMQRRVRDFKLGPGFAQAELMARLGRSEVREFSIAPKLVEPSRDGQSFVVVLPGTSGDVRLRVPKRHMVLERSSARFYLPPTSWFQLFDRKGRPVRMVQPDALYEWLDRPQTRVGVRGDRQPVVGKTTKQKRFLEYRERQVEELREFTQEWAVREELGEHAEAQAAERVRELAREIREVAAERERVRDAVRSGRMSASEGHQMELSLNGDLMMLEREVKRFQTVLRDEKQQRTPSKSDRGTGRGRGGRR